MNFQKTDYPKPDKSGSQERSPNRGVSIRRTLNLSITKAYSSFDLFRDAECGSKFLILNWYARESVFGNIRRFLFVSVMF